MTKKTVAADREAPLSDDILLTARVEHLLGRANTRQLWTLFLDENDVQAPELMPIDNLPSDPGVMSRVADLGLVTCAELLAARIAPILTAHGLTQVVFVWERRGGPFAEDEERAWARELAGACGRAGVRVRAQFLLHTRGVRVLAPDDYL